MEGEAIKFSVLMSVYNKENPAYLERAIKSIWDDQILKPAEIIIVEDGPLSNGILFVLDKWDKRLKDKFRRVQLEVNSGLGPALRAGLLKCKYNIVARMDSDDISLPNRFNLQLNLINKKGIGIVGCWVEEFDENNKVIGTRKTPQNHEDIYNFSRFRNPMNHPSVIFKKNLVIEVGSYENYLFFEDYHLWVKLLVNNVKFSNVNKVLLIMRNNSQINRRHGKKYLINEIIFINELFKMKHINLLYYIFMIFSRPIVRIMPQKITTIIYNILRGSK